MFIKMFLGLGLLRCSQARINGAMATHYEQAMSKQMPADYKEGVECYFCISGNSEIHIQTHQLFKPPVSFYVYAPCVDKTALTH